MESYFLPYSTRVWLCLRALFFSQLQSISHSCVEKVKPKRSHKSCSPPTKRSHVPKRFKSHGKVSSHSKIRQKKKVKPGVPCTHRYVRSNSRWLPNAIATETLPPVRKRSLKALPRQTNSFSASNIKSTVSLFISGLNCRHIIWNKNHSLLIFTL